MKYLLDTNIISETVRPQPNKNIQKWLSEIPSESLFISALTLREIRKGIETLKGSKRKNHLILWLEQELPTWFGENFLPIDHEVAERWGYITSLKQHQLRAIDSLLAATALTHNLKMVTRNIKDFNVPGLEILNPFE
ncbi:MAG: type II toxin-antitoxin system VapC family toxin [Candidatus Paracaedibacter sp.]